MAAGNAGLWGFLKARKWWILMPFVLIVVLFALLMLLGEGSQLSPFAYELF